jgi:hypothetical protein
MTRSTSSTPSLASAGSMSLGTPAVSSASTRWISASCAWRRRTKPTVLSSAQVHTGVSAGVEASTSSRPALTVA